ncbi:hypothetical protein FOZ62_023922, partial [Perkinsus olseni]
YRDFIIAVLDTATRELAVEYSRQHSNLADSLTRLPVFLHAYASTEDTGHAIVNTSISILSSHVDKVPFWVLSRSTAHLAVIAAREHSNDALIGLFRLLARLECTEIAEFAREIFAFYTALWRLNEALHDEETESMRRWLGSKLESLAATKEDIFFDGFALENLCVLLSETKLETSELLREIDKRVLDEDVAALSPPALIQCLRLLGGIPSSPSATLQRRLAHHICRVQWLSPEAVLELATYIEGAHSNAWLGRSSEGLIRVAARELYRGLSVMEDDILKKICMKLSCAMKKMNADEYKLVNLLVAEYSDEHDT